MRVLGLILVMVMISTSSQSSERKRDFTLCSEIAYSMNDALGLHSSQWSVVTHLLKTDKDTDAILLVLDEMDKSLTKASKYATIYNAKCK